jgi:hypothetical protein
MKLGALHCAQIEFDVAVLRVRRLDHQSFVYVWLDAPTCTRVNRRVVSKALVIARAACWRAKQGALTLRASQQPCSSTSVELRVGLLIHNGCEIECSPVGGLLR